MNTKSLMMASPVFMGLIVIALCFMPNEIMKYKLVEFPSQGSIIRGRLTT